MAHRLPSIRFLPGWDGLLPSSMPYSSIYLIYLSFKYAWTILSGLGALGADGLTWFVVILLALLTIVNAVILMWIFVQVVKGISSSKAMPLVTLAGLIFLGFLDWLLVVWFWDPNVLPEALPAVGTYAIGWSNVSSMIFMLINYLRGSGDLFWLQCITAGRQGIQIEKVYKEIPVE